MREMSLEEIQGCSLSILKEFDKFCKNHEMRYWLIGGSALGAIRHRGFIPWDDDIDVGMPRRDYERFCSAYKDSKSFYLLSAKRNEAYVKPYAKLCASNTLFDEPTKMQVRYGVFIDIFPIDYIRGSDFVISLTLNRKRLYSLAFTTNLNSDLYMKEPILKRTLRHILSHVYARRNPHKLMDEITSSIASDTPTDKVMNIWGRWGKREVSNSELLDSCVELPFEDMICPVPADWHNYLTALYDDYMTLPPVAQRVAHGGKAWRLESIKHEVRNHIRNY